MFFQFKKSFLVDDAFSNYIIDLYLIEEDINLQDLTFDFNEVKRASYFSLEMIKNKIQKNQMWNYEETNMTKAYFTHL